MVIDDMEFSSAMRDKLSYKGPQHVLRQLFASLDTNASGTISFDELVSQPCLDYRCSRSYQVATVATLLHTLNCAVRPARAFSV